MPNWSLSIWTAWTIWHATLEILFDMTKFESIIVEE